MKYVGIFVGGLVLGIVLAAGLLWVNPLTSEPRQTPRLTHGVTMELHYGLQPEAAPLLTHSGERRLLRRPDAAPELWESTVRPVVAALLVLRDGDGEVIGAASRLGAFSRSTDPLLRGVTVDSVWLVNLYHHGMGFVVQRENVWPMLKAVAVPSILRRAPWSGELSFTPAAGPLSDRAAHFSGIAGEIAGIEGEFVVSYDLSEFDPRVGPTGLAARAVLSLPPEAEATPR